MQETWVRSLGQEDPLEKEMATQLQYSCLVNPTDGGAWWATVHGVAKSQTRLSDLTSLHFKVILILYTASTEDYYLDHDSNHQFKSPLAALTDYQTWAVFLGFWYTLVQISQMM